MLHQQSSTSHGLAKRAEKQFTATQVAAGTGQQGEEQQKRVGDQKASFRPPAFLPSHASHAFLQLASM